MIGVVAVREQGYHRETDHPRRSAVRAVLEPATGELALREKLQPTDVHALDLICQRVIAFLKQFLRVGRR